MSEQYIHHAILLLQQQKYREAEKILSGLFAQEPANTEILNLLSEVKIGQNKYEEALDLANKSIGLDPANPITFHIRARIFVQQDKYDDAERDLQTAISLDPLDADYYALLSLIKLDRKKYKEGLELADQALEADPENVTALNARSTALLKLNRKDESFATIEEALQGDPNNAYTHANYGWGLLEKGDAKKALSHFSEALRRQPNLDIAQSGMKESLKARYTVYRWFLQYSLWIGNLQAKFQWGVIIGFYVLTRVLRSVAASNPSVEPFVTPIIVLFAVMAFSTWIITPISNLFLRFNKYGKYLLDKDEIFSSNLVAVSLGITAAGGLLLLLTTNEAYLSLVIFGIVMLIPLSSAFTAGKQKLLIGYTIVLALGGAFGIFLAFANAQLWNIAFILFLAGGWIYQWVANAILVRAANR